MRIVVIAALSLPLDT